MSKELELVVPTSLDGVKLKDYQKYLLLLDKNKDSEDLEFINLKTIEIFCGLDVREVRKLPYSLVESILGNISELFKQDTPLTRSFKLKDSEGNIVEFGFIPDLHKMSYGEFVDAEKYFIDFNQMHKLMAVMYRPITFRGSSETYLIEDYKGTEYLSDIMLEAPVSVAIGMRVFFWTLENKLLKHTMDCIVEEIKVTSEDYKRDLEENGVLFNQYMNSQMEMLGDLMKLQNFHYTNV